ncbi:hypothetical protein KHQ06_17460 [Nocardia tengchongensis]|uniref:Uncharacterized protein n=1 Tax=Nocardia tengchongensis TaxID=2055889 RepID=A0ABX8CWW1_9NOCA|nr:hypothetical protein KHQ06_17460 [Nocardia tengchongensis]
MADDLGDIVRGQAAGQHHLAGYFLEPVGEFGEDAGSGAGVVEEVLAGLFGLGRHGRAVGQVGQVGPVVELNDVEVVDYFVDLAAVEGDHEGPDLAARVGGEFAGPRGFDVPLALGGADHADGGVAEFDGPVDLFLGGQSAHFDEHGFPAFP